MLHSVERDALYPVVNPILEKMGYSVVDLRSHRVRETLHVSLVIYSAKGVSVDDCSEVYRTVYPRMQVVGDNREIHLEVSSPGLTRSFRAAEEFGIFVGRSVQVLAEEDADWLTARVVEASADSVLLETASGTRRLPYDAIRKARLDLAQEAEK